MVREQKLSGRRREVHGVLVIWVRCTNGRRAGPTMAYGCWRWEKSEYQMAPQVCCEKIVTANRR